MKASEALTKVKELINQPGVWGKGSPLFRSDKTLCIVQALTKVTGEEFNFDTPTADEVLQSFRCDDVDIVTFNDDENTTIEMMNERLDKAIAESKEAE